MRREGRRIKAAEPQKAGQGRTLAGSVLAISAALAAPVAAQEPDQTQEGTVAPEAPGDSEVDSPTFDPGGDDDLPFNVGPAPDADQGDTGLDTEPVEDLDYPDPSAWDDQSPPTDDQAPVPPAEEQTPEAPASPAEPSLQTPPPPPASPPMSEQQIHRLQPEGPPVRSHGGTVRLIAEARAQIGRPVEPPLDEAPRIAASPPARRADSANQPLVVKARARRNEPDGNGGVHVVAPGESLWAIAEDLVGPRASTARIAREVQRLWSLNEARIGTGDPDLLMVGTELRLR